MSQITSDTEIHDNMLDDSIYVLLNIYAFPRTQDHLKGRFSGAEDAPNEVATNI
jgi:hypothetical protein